MKFPITNPVYWCLETLLSFESEELHDLAKVAAGTLTSYRLILGRCLQALHLNKGFKHYGCSSSTHYACSVLGLHPREARTTRRVARLLQDLPELTLAAEQGNIAWSKLREIIRKASPQTESFWLKLAESRSYKEIEMLVRRTPKGSIPGEVDTDPSSVTSELRCNLSDEVFAMLAQARRVYSLEKGEAVTNAEVLEWALASYVANQPLDSECLEKVRAESNKDLQAERAREIPLVAEARELAHDFGLLSDGSEEQAETEIEENALVQALGSTALTECCETSKCPARVKILEPSWENPNLRFNPKSRFATKYQKTEILRRDGWCCSAPGCVNKVWLHLHHLKPYSQGGLTERDSLLSLCSNCHLNHHRGILKIKIDSQGKLQFFDEQGRNLNQQAQLELAGWLDYWIGWRGRERDSRTHRSHAGTWALAV